MSYNSALVELLNKPDANQIYLLNGHTSYSFEYESFTRQELLGCSQNEVWKFTHKTTGKELAAKVVPLRKNRNNLDPANYDHLMKIMHEIEILRTLRNHNNIIQFYGYGIDKESALLFMELMDYSLGDLLALQRTSRYYWINSSYNSYSGFVYLITTSCLSALEFCFHMRIRNNDIKPANILLNKKGKVKISDFGEASKFGESQNLGSLLYRPSLFHNSKSNLKESEHDLWGLGITLLEILYGQNPILMFHPYKSAKNKLIGLIDFLKDLNSQILLSYGYNHIFIYDFEDFFFEFIREIINTCLSNETSKQIIKDLSNILINYVVKSRNKYPLKTNVIKDLEVSNIKFNLISIGAHQLHFEFSLKSKIQAVQVVGTVK
jgi:serine/threonine protein kinase